MLLLWFLLPSTATHCTLSLLLFPLPVVKFLPLLQTAVALLKVTSEIFMADSTLSLASPSVGLCPVVQAGNAVISWGLHEVALSGVFLSPQQYYPCCLFLFWLPYSFLLSLSAFPTLSTEHLIYSHGFNLTWEDFQISIYNSKFS